MRVVTPLLLLPGYWNFLQVAALSVRACRLRPSKYCTTQD